MLNFNVQSNSVPFEVIMSMQQLATSLYQKDQMIGMQQGTAAAVPTEQQQGIQEQQ
jgi:hypothetical protein